MIQSLGVTRALACAAGGILLCGAALARQQTQAAKTATSVVSTATTSTSSTPPSAATSISNAPSAPAAAVGTPAAKSASTAAVGSTSSSANSSEAVRTEEALLIEGENRFATNCGRCHQAPHKFPPRMMATIVRHMRVRATITDDDMRLILRYMTQ